MSNIDSFTNSVQKALDLTTPAKNRRKTSIIGLFWPLGTFEIGLSYQLYTSWFFVKCKCPNSYSVQWAYLPPLSILTISPIPNPLLGLGCHFLCWLVVEAKPNKPSYLCTTGLKDLWSYIWITWSTSIIS